MSIEFLIGYGSGTGPPKMIGSGRVGSGLGNNGSGRVSGPPKNNGSGRVQISGPVGNSGVRQGAKATLRHTRKD